MRMSEKICFNVAGLACDTAQVTMTHATVLHRFLKIVSPATTVKFSDRQDLSMRPRNAHDFVRAALLKESVFENLS